jgi:hypothetical protein
MFLIDGSMRYSEGTSLFFWPYTLCASKYAGGICIFDTVVFQVGSNLCEPATNLDPWPIVKFVHSLLIVPTSLRGHARRVLAGWLTTSVNQSDGYRPLTR